VVHLPSIYLRETIPWPKGIEMKPFTKLMKSKNLRAASHLPIVEFKNSIQICVSCTRQ
jgi:hypothetical protein